MAGNAGRKFPPPPPPRLPLSVRADKLRRSLDKLLDRFYSRAALSLHFERASVRAKLGKSLFLRDALRFLFLGVVPVIFVFLSARSLLWKSLWTPRLLQFVPFDGLLEPYLGRGRGISIVAACETDLHDNAVATAESWLAQDSVDDVILIDWSPRAEYEDRFSRFDDRIRVVHVSDDGAWCAARIYNVGISLALNAHVGLVGCRHGLQGPRFLSTMRAARVAYNVVEEVALVDRTAFRNVGGFREFACVGALASYRHDAEIVDRLNRSGLSTQTLALSRGDDAWLMADAMNILLHSQNVPSDVKQCRFNVMKSTSRTGRLSFLFPGLIELPITLETTSAPGRFTARLVNGAWGESVGRELHDRFGIVWDLLIGLDDSERHRLLQKLRWRQERIKEEVASSPSAESVSQAILDTFVYEAPRLLVVHVMHGLGNRLRALASAMAFAERTNRQLFLIWERSPHCGAFFNELFERDLSGMEGDNIFIVDSFPVQFKQFEYASIRDFAWREWRVYNYMSMDGSSAVKDEAIADDRFKHIYFKSAYVMNAVDKKLTGWDMDNQQLARLVPTARVRDLVDSYHEDVFFSEHTIGVHIRSFSLSSEKNIDALKEYGLADSKILAYWRSRSQAVHFIAEMQSLLAGNKHVNFFVASDSWNVVSEVKQIFPGRVLSVKSDSCDGRNAACMQFALADLILLGKTQSMLGSPWSSFTEGARRFGCRNVRIAGIDFALDSRDVAELPAAVRETFIRLRRKRRKKGKRDHLT